MQFDFNLQLFAVALPDNPSTSSATVGKDFLLSVNTGTVAVPIWALIGGQRGSSLGRSADSIDVSHKTSGGWKSTKAGLRGWSIDLDGLVLLSDPGLEALETAFDLSKEVHLKFEYPNGKYRTGWAAITDFSFDTPHDGEASLKGSLEGNGPLSALTDPVVAATTVTPLIATFSKATAVDKTFTVTPSTAAITSIDNAGSILTVTTDYTYATGTLTIKSAYLGGLATGVKTLTVTPITGSAINIDITITA